MTQKIESWYSNWCYKNQYDEDLFDIKSEIDSNISDDENIGILETKLSILKESGTFNKLQQKKKELLLEQEKHKQPLIVNQTIDVKRILSNNLTILMSRITEAKTSFLCALIEQYKKDYSGDVYVYGFNSLLARKLNVISFYSLIELEKIRSGIIVIDEVKTLFDLENRKKFSQVDNIFRLVAHNGNKLLLSGLPSDFKKFICSKATCFLYKGLDITELINGSRAKDILNQYTGTDKGTFTLDLDKNQVLCYDNKFWKETFAYNPEYDTKKANINLFNEKKCTDNCAKSVPKKEEIAYKLICGHNNGYKEPIYPFDWVCKECGMKTSENKLQKVI